MQKDRGFIGTIVLIILALAALKYFFNFSIFEFLGTTEGKNVLEYVKEILVWLKDVVVALWSYIH